MRNVTLSLVLLLTFVMMFSTCYCHGAVSQASVFKLRSELVSGNILCDSCTTNTLLIFALLLNCIKCCTCIIKGNSTNDVTESTNCCDWADGYTRCWGGANDCYQKIGCVQEWSHCCPAAYKLKQHIAEWMDDCCKKEREAGRSGC